MEPAQMKRLLLIILPCYLLSGCTFGMSLDERYQKAYQAVIQDPNADNVSKYMELSKKLADRDMAKANKAAEKATSESDKSFTEYFNKYGSDDFKSLKRNSD